MPKALNMTLDELVQSIPEDDSDLRENLTHWVDEWKKDSNTVNHLTDLILKWHGNVWFNNQQAQNKFYEDWLQFKETAIEGIGGMTMNERLYRFGLFEDFDNCTDENSKLAIYKKLLG